MPTVDQLLDRLVTVLGTHGIAPPGAAKPETAAMLAEIDEAIRPWRLPDGVRRFWECVDPQTVRMNIGPHFTDLDFALYIWREHLPEGTTPPSLFPLSYESHDFYFVELDGPDDGQGGSIWRWAYDSATYEHYFDSIEHLLVSAVDAIEAGRCKDAGGQIFVVTDPAQEYYPYLGPPDRRPHQGYDVLQVRDSRDHWPDRWIASVGWDPAERYARGGDSTLADVPASLAAGTDTVRVWATVRVEARIDDNGGRAVIEVDGAELDIYVPRQLPLSYRQLRGDTLEFDLIAPRPADAAAMTMPAERLSKASPKVAEAWQRWTRPPQAVAAAIRLISPS